MAAAEYFGIHWIESIAWLVQDRDSVNFVGLRQKCPLKKPGGDCPHQVPTDDIDPTKEQWDTFMEIADDPLVQAMLPIPHPADDKTFFIEDAGNNLSNTLITLSRLTSPTVTAVRPMWMLRKSIIRKELVSTNIQPLVVTGTIPRNRAMFEMLVEYSLFTPRTLVVTGAPEIVIPPQMKRISTAIDRDQATRLAELPLERIGAAIIKQHARMEGFQ